MKGRPTEGLAQWRRYDLGARALRTTGRQGPKWSDVLYRSTRDMDSGEYLEDCVSVKGMGGARLHALLDRARDLETTLYYGEETGKEETHLNPVAESAGGALVPAAAAEAEKGPTESGRSGTVRWRPRRVRGGPAQQARPHAPGAHGRRKTGSRAYAPSVPLLVPLLREREDG